jgi:hypothetical protein
MSQNSDEDHKGTEAFKSFFRYVAFYVVVIVAGIGIYWLVNSPMPFRWSRRLPFLSSEKSDAQVELERHHRAVERQLQYIGAELYDANQQREWDYYQRPLLYDRHRHDD